MTVGVHQELEMPKQSRRILDFVYENRTREPAEEGVRAAVGQFGDARQILAACRNFPTLSLSK